METNLLFTRTMATLGRALDLRSEKHELIASNIANMDTPGYKPFDLLVEETLQKEDGPAGVTLAATRPGHIGGNPAQGRIEQIVQRTADAGQVKGDGNAVDVDREMSALAENSLMYSVLTRSLSKKFAAIRLAISGGTP